MHTQRRILFLALFLPAACLPEAPANPTWADDVQPILQANCVRCHGAKPQGGAPPTFRLDMLSASGAVTANTLAPFIAARAGTLGDMPPGGPELNQYQRDVLTNWAKMRMEGARTGNRAPTVSLKTERVGAELVVTYDITDADGDSALGTIKLGEIEFQASIHAGHGEVRLDASSWVTGSYPLVVTARDDFGGMGEGTATVEIANATLAPFAFIDVGGDFFLSTATPSLRVLTRACQALAGEACGVPDGQPFADLDLFAVRGKEVVPLATGVRVSTGQTAVVPWNPALVPHGTNWRIRAVVDSGMAERTYEVGPIIVSHVLDSPQLGDVRPLFLKYCEPCHALGAPNTPIALVVFSDLCPDEETRSDACYRDNLLSGIGVTALYRRVVDYQIMPPPSAKLLVGVSPPTPAERLLIGEWLLAGGPL